MLNTLLDIIKIQISRATINLPKYWLRSARSRTNKSGGRRRIGGVQYMYTSFNTSSSHDNTSSSSVSVKPVLAEVDSMYINITL